MHPLVRSVRKQLAASGDPARAPAMQAYMKTDQPFHGVMAPERRRIVREAMAEYPLATRDQYERVVRELWAGQCREDMYAALDVAERAKTWRTLESFALYEDLLREATNWDTVDPIAANLVGDLVRDHRELESRVFEWSDDPSFWMRRASLLAHLKHKGETNVALLERTILKLAHEKEFFIRKAIGWVLREHSKTDRDSVARFVRDHPDELSGLSRREATRHL